MFYSILLGKIHGATVTEANIDYMGSITIDEDLICEAGFLINQKVEVYDITNGTRLATYIIKGERGSGVICLNGAAAKLIQKGDKVIIAGYTLMNKTEALKHKPSILLVDENNRVTEKKTV